MSLGLASSIILAIMIVLWLTVGLESNSDLFRHDLYRIVNWQESAIGRGQRRAAFDGTVRLSKSYQHSGFSGYRGYIIVPDNEPNSVKVERLAPSVSELNTVEIAPFDPCAAIGNSTTDMGFLSTAIGPGGFGLPDGCANLIEIAGEMFPPTAMVSFPKASERAFIKLIKRPRAANDIWGRGLVVVEFVITKRGRLRSLVVIKEEPEGCGAADSLLYALGEAVFWAAKVNGRKVDTQVLFKWEYCVGNDCEDYGSVCYGDQALIVNDLSTVDESRPPTPTGYLWK
ncbi:MAG: hypothetical protein P1R58_13120 [bacterium]|nr:hypothetical protein [bacterium]